MTNIENSKGIISQLIEFGVSDFVICPGGRCAPLIAAINEDKNINTHYFFDERSASFFALGIGKKSNKPAVIVTTSGTAVSECLSAFIEAHYSSVPLIVLSADRPKSYRGSGAPQAIDQADIFSNYATHSYDLENEKLLKALDGQVHINICFDEPLLGDKMGSAIVSSAAKPALLKKPLVIVGALSHAERSTVSQFLKKYNLICYLESASNLKNEKGLNKLAAHSRQINLDFINLNFDSVIRIGAVPTLRLWRDLEKSNIPVLSFSEAKFSGLSRVKEKAQPISALAGLKLAEIGHGSGVGIEKIKADFDGFSSSEPSFIHELSKVIPEDAILFLGNSLVLRNWDDYAITKAHQKIYVNRGANGIDGLISTALGCAEEGKDLWVVVGDQSALYDMQALWVVSELKNIKVRIVVINNNGGKIFSKVFKSESLLESLENSHQLSFKPWANMFGLEYHLATDATKLKVYKEESIVIECAVDNKQTTQFIESLNV